MVEGHLAPHTQFLRNSWEDSPKLDAELIDNNIKLLSCRESRFAHYKCVLRGLLLPFTFRWPEETNMTSCAKQLRVGKLGIWNSLSRTAVGFKRVTRSPEFYTLIEVNVQVLTLDTEQFLVTRRSDYRRQYGWVHLSVIKLQRVELDWSSRYE